MESKTTLLNACSRNPSLKAMMRAIQEENPSLSDADRIQLKHYFKMFPKAMTRHVPGTTITFHRGGGTRFSFEYIVPCVKD